MLEVTDAVVSVWGAGRVGMHFAPRADAHDMGDSDLAATFGYVARELGSAASPSSAPANRPGAAARPALKAAFGGVYIANEGFDRETAEAALAAGEADAVAFGKLFIANPDLPRRFSLGAPLNAWNAETFYSEGPVGYTDYPALEDKAAAADKAANAGRSRLQVFDLHEGVVERVGVDHIVLDALPARVRNVPLERGGARAAAWLLEKEVAVRERDHDIVGLMAVPARLAPGVERDSVTRTCGSEMWT